MPQNSIERMLQLNSKLESVNESAQRPHKPLTSSDVDRIVEQYDQQVFGPTTEIPLKEGERPHYDPNVEMERLKKIAENGSTPTLDVENSKIPKTIIESIINNPLNLKPLDPRMDALEERLKDSMPGIKSAVNILERVENQEKAKGKQIKEQRTLKPIQTTETENLRELISEVFDEKISELTQTLNEGRTSSYIPSMKCLSFKDNFYFVDNDDNVFECVMNYKGKRKRKN